MNAYELADNLIKNLTMEYDYTDKYMEDAANMLRQQADRILELDVNLKAQVRLAYEQADRIAELEKELTFQPNQTLACPSYLSGLTPQTKPLSDEEIVEFVNKYIDYVPDDDGGMMVVGVNDLCRAIEAKVRGEK